MDETSLSLLKRLRNSPESASWRRLVELYAPLIRAWLRKYDVQESDAEDLVQEVLLAVSKDLATFEHQGQPGAFRGWLKGILVNRLRNFWRARDRRREARRDSDLDERLAELENPASELSQLWNDEHHRYVLRQLLELVSSHSLHELLLSIWTVVFLLFPEGFTLRHWTSLVMCHCEVTCSEEGLGPRSLAVASVSLP